MTPDERDRMQILECLLLLYKALVALRSEIDYKVQDPQRRESVYRLYAEGTIDAIADLEKQLAELDSRGLCDPHPRPSEMSARGKKKATVTTKHLYVAINAPGASDSNAGDDPLFPIKTLDEAIRRVNALASFVDPYVAHFGSGAYERTETLGPLPLRESVFFIGDGGGQVGDDGCTTLATGVVDTGSSTTLLKVTGGGLTVDAFLGKTVEILTGAAAGDRRTIRNNTATDVVPAASFSAALVQGDTFRVFEPAVEFQAPGGILGVKAEPFVIGVGYAGARAAQTRNAALSPSLYLCNVRLTGPTNPGPFKIYAWDVAGSSVVFCGVELLEKSLHFQTLTADGRSHIRAGVDEMISATNVYGPVDVGLAASASKWRGWGVAQPAPSTPATIELENFTGFGVFLGLVIHGASWWLIGGTVQEFLTPSYSLHARARARVTLGDWLPTRKGTPVLVRHSGGTDVRYGAIRSTDGAIVNLQHVLVEKKNAGVGVAVSSGEHEGVEPGQISIAGDSGLVTINGITDTSAPNWGIAVYAGGRITFLDGYLVMNGWPTGQQTAVFSHRFDQAPPDVAQDLSAYLNDGASIVALDGSRIQRL